MADELGAVFIRGATFRANPHLYDYVHQLEFNPDSSIEMVDGAGQVLNTLVKARFALSSAANASYVLHFFDVVEIDPYYKVRRFRGLDLAAFAKATAHDLPYDEEDVRQRMEPFRIQVIREGGPFLLKSQVIWRINDELDWPYLLYRARYRFNKDPLARFPGTRPHNLYYQLESPEPDTRVYYQLEDERRLTARELPEVGMDAGQAEL